MLVGTFSVFIIAYLCGLSRGTPPVAFGDSPLMEGAFGSTINFPVLPKAPPPGELANPKDLTEGVSQSRSFLF